MTTVCVPDATARDAISFPADVDVVVWDGRSTDVPTAAARVRFFLASPGCPPRDVRFELMPDLRIVQLPTAGYEGWLEALPAPVSLANARGVHGPATAEFAVGLLTAALRGFGRYAAQQRQGQWLRHRAPALCERRVLVVGAGDIGTRIGAALRAFDAPVTLVGRHPRADGTVHAAHELAGLLPHHDVVVLAVPLDDSTHHLVDEPFLAALPDGSIVVNVARGPVIDTDALVRELTRGRIGAALDVTDPEPLPAAHPLWSAPNLVLTPHVAGYTDSTRRTRDFVADQVRRFAAGLPVRNLIGSKAPAR